MANPFLSLTGGRLNQYTLFVILTSFSIAVCLYCLFSLLAYQKGKILKGLTTIVVMLIFICIFNIAALVSKRPDPTQLYSSMVYVLHAFFSITVLYTALQYNQEEYAWVVKFFPAFFILPLFLLLVMFTPYGVHFVWKAITFTPVINQWLLMRVSYGSWFWINVIFQYAILILSYSIVSSKYMLNRSMYKNHIMWVALGLIIAASGNLIHLLKIFTWLKQDYTCVTMVFGGSILILSSLRNNIVDLMPIARSTVFDQMQDGIIVLNNNNRVVDYNVPVQKILPQGLKERLGWDVEQIIPDLENWEEKTQNGSTFEVEIEKPLKRIFEIGRENVVTSEGNDIGRIISLHDITETARLRRELEKLATQDFLTGLTNRREFFKQADLAIAQSRRHKLDLSLIMFDLDFFKAVNDTYGHLIGDEILILISRLVESCVRNIDIFSRFGGEEFLILLPFTNLEKAVLIAERIHAVVKQEPFKTSVGPVAVTISLGVSCFNNDHPKDSINALINRADWALYQAKANGRNRVCVCDMLDCESEELIYTGKTTHIRNH